MSFEKEIQNIESETELVQGYDNTVISVLQSYITNSHRVALCEYGRGNGKLFSYLSQQVDEIKIIEDFGQTIFQADRNNYKDFDQEDIIEYNVLSSGPLKEKFDVIYASLPNFVPQFDTDIFQSRLDMAFKNLISMLNPKGYLISVDYNTTSVKQSIQSLNLPISKYIVTNEDLINPEHYVCVVYNSE